MLGRFEQFLEIAKALKPDSQNGSRTFHVSFLVNKGKILSIGINNCKTHPKNLLNPKFSKEGRNISSEKYTCSELNCFIKAKNTNQNIKYNKCTLINIRIDKNNQLCNSEPCISCKNLIKYMGVKDVFHTTNEGVFKKYG